MNLFPVLFACRAHSGTEFPTVTTILRRHRPAREWTIYRA
jgi:hypothetical protein